MQYIEELLTRFTRVDSIKEGMRKSKVTIAYYDNPSYALYCMKEFIEQIPEGIEYRAVMANKTVELFGCKVIFTSNIEATRGITRGSSIYFDIN